MTENSLPPSHAPAPGKLRSFGRRVRIVRSWRGLAVGACFGAAASAVWAALDWTGVAYTEWVWMGALVLGAAAVGALVGALRPLSAEALARSIDRRAHLEDRLSTATERAGDAGPFDDALRTDASAKLDSLSPKRIYPLRVGRWQGGAAALTALAAAIFLLGNTPLLLSSEARQNRQDLQQQGQKVERIARENLDTPEARTEMSEAEKKLADELRRYQRDLEKARMSKEEAMQVANQIAKKADDLMRQNAKQSEDSLDSAAKALQRMQAAELAKAGLQNVDPALAQLSPDEMAQREQAARQQLQQAQQALDTLQAKLNALDQKLKDPKLSEAERKALEEQRKELAKQAAAAKSGLDAARKALSELKMSEHAMDVMRRMMDNPLYKEIQALASKLKMNADAASRDGRPTMSDADRKEAQRELDALVAKLKDQKAMEEYLKQMLEALKHANRMARCNKIGFGLGLIPIPGTGAPGNSRMLVDIGKVNHSAKALPSEGSTTTSMITGSQRPTGEPSPYIEIKAPTTIGNRSAVPYVKVLPSYRRKAESALNRQEIPKDQEKRVKAYFDSLGH